MSTPTEPDEVDATPAQGPVESRGDRTRRHARRTKLYLWAGLLVATLVLLVVLIAENTRSVKVGWVFGYSRVSLVFLVLLATVLGWLLGIATSVIFRRRTRRPSP